MKKIIYFLAFVIFINVSDAQTFFQKNGNLSSDAIDKDIDFDRTKTDITIPVAGNYMILISAQGSTQATNGNPFSCYQRDGIVKVWSRTRNIELARTPINHIFADQNGQSVGNPPGLIQKTFPYYNIMIVALEQGELIGLRGFVSKQCPSNTALGKWSIFDARIKIVKL